MKSCNREVLWRNYFLQRSSEKFGGSWVSFLTTLHLTPTSILYQHLTDLIFHQLIQRSCLGSESKATAPPLNKSEGIEGCDARPQEEELILCLVSLLKGSDSEDCGTEKDWIKAQNRGGLT